jgi:hypothetical protein
VLEKGKVWEMCYNGRGSETLVFLAHFSCFSVLLIFYEIMGCVTKFLFSTTWEWIEESESFRLR